MTQEIDYGNLMHHAMRGLIKQVLTQVSRDGLPGDHHFFITFDTRHPGVDIADWLRARYPEEMTIVLQHWFDNLVVTDDGFSITLNFGNQPEPLVVPYDALRTFVDPSVEFGLRFESSTDDDEDDDEDAEVDSLVQGTSFDTATDTATDTDPDDTPDPPARGQVVRLDTFRK